MLVYCCGMQRAGSTLQYQFAAEIVRYRGVGRALGWLSDVSPAQLKVYLEDERLFIVKIHRYTEDKGALISKGKAKAIYVYRDIRDVIASILNKYKHSFKDIIRWGRIEEILENYYGWTSVDDILVSKYETMVKDLKKEVFRIADYLGINSDELSASRIAQGYTIEKQRERIQSFDYENLGVRVGKGIIYDPVSLLHSNHIYSGESEQWKKTLSPLQVALIEKKARDWLVDRGYPLAGIDSLVNL